MEAKFTHLSGDIRQPVLVVGDDPDVPGNTLYAPLLPVQSIGAANLFDSPVDSPTDTVDGAKGDTSAADKGDTSAADTSAQTATDTTAQIGETTSTSGDAAYVDNGDGTWTRTSDGARGHFGPDGFVASGGEEVTGVSWGGAS